MNDDAILAKASALLIELGAQPVRNGRLTLHFDGQGLVQDVEVNFKRKVRHAVTGGGPVRAPQRSN